MHYYDELFENLDFYIRNKDFKKAKEVLDNELSMPYVPSDVLEKLKKYIDFIPKDNVKFSLNDDEIFDYLKQDEEKQLIAVECLNKKNLRDYIDICNEYLKSNGFLNAKVLLIDSLIKQDIGDDISYINNGIEYTFIPKFIMPVEQSDGYITAIKHLNDLFMKEPSMLEMAKSLVYKECLLALPINLDDVEGELLAKNVYEYIKKAFGEYNA